MAGPARDVRPSTRSHGPARYLPPRSLPVHHVVTRHREDVGLLGKLHLEDHHGAEAESDLA